MQLNHQETPLIQKVDIILCEDEKDLRCIIFANDTLLADQ